MRSIIENAIREYNKYRSPEVVAMLLSINGNKFNLEFTGTFCQTCGFHDYFDDYQILLEEKGLRTKIVEINEEDEGAIVIYEILPS